MKTRNVSAATLMAAAALLTAPLANAVDAEVTFMIPVDLSGFPPEVENILIHCHLVADYATSGYVAVPLVDGAYRGTVTIVHRQNIGLNPAATIPYECELTMGTARFGSSSSPGTTVSLQGASYQHSLKAPAAAGTKPVIRVTGTITLQPATP